MHSHQGASKTLNLVIVLISPKPRNPKHPGASRMPRGKGWRQFSRAFRRYFERCRTTSSSNDYFLVVPIHMPIIWGFDEKCVANWYWYLPSSPHTNFVPICTKTLFWDSIFFTRSSSCFRRCQGWFSLLFFVGALGFRFNFQWEQKRLEIRIFGFQTCFAFGAHVLCSFRVADFRA